MATRASRICCRELVWSFLRWSLGARERLVESLVVQQKRIRWSEGDNTVGAQHGAGKLEVVPRVKRFIYTVLQPKTMAGLSFPPLLESWKGASQGRQFPGSQETWKKALQPRPLRHTPSEQTVHDIQMACGPNFKLVQQATQIGDEFVRRDGAPPPSMQAPPARPPGRGLPASPRARSPRPRP